MAFRLFLIPVLFSLSMIGLAQPPAADSVLSEAMRTAARENKNVFILFHASWCIWCHKMDSSMNDQRCKLLFNDNYVIRHLTVLESEKNKRFENPGANAMLARYRAHDDGIPFWLVFDKEGKLLADSRIKAEGAALNTKGRNSGCPATKEEVDYFISVLRNTSRLSAAQLEIIEKRFKENDN